MWKRVNRQRERLTPSLSVSHPELHIFPPSPFENKYYDFWNHLHNECWLVAGVTRMLLAQALS